MENNAIERKKEKRNTLLICLGLFIVYFILWSAYRNIGIFNDEADNILGGLVVKNGGIIYRDFYSQHTPLMYYICGVFGLLGASTLVQFRLFFYGLMSLIWVIMYLRYANYFGKITMIIFPILYIVSIVNIGQFAGMILSEHIQTQGIIFLLLEFLIYIKNREISLISAIFIAIGIWMAFGVAFVSVFSIIVILLGVMLIEIVDGFKNEKKMIENFQLFLKKIWKVVLLCVIPLICGIIFYKYHGMLRDVYEQVYSLNRDVYSLYSNYGGGILDTVKNIYTWYFLSIESTIKNLFITPYSSIRMFINFIVNAFFVMYVYKNDKLAAFVVFGFIITLGARGFEGFHAMVYWYVTALMAAIILGDYFKKNQNWSFNKQKFASKIAIICVVFLVITSYMQIFPQAIPDKKEFDKTEFGVPSVEYYVNTLTNQEDKIQMTSLNNHVYINTDRLPASKHMYSYTPWFIDAYEQAIISDWESSKPKIVEFDQGTEVWGYNIVDSAPNMVQYIYENYTKLDGTINIWIRNDYYDEALKRLGE